MEDYRTRRGKQCQEAMKDFHPDFEGCRNIENARVIFEMTKQGYRSKDIAESIGKTPKAVQKFWVRYGFPCLHNIEPLLQEEQPMWKGGIKEAKGYFLKRCPEHPNRSKHGGYVAVHRLVMEEKLGRYLTREEVVDHIDRNPKNNHPDNLRVFPNNAEHLRVTLKGKVPNWSDEGKKAISDAVKLRHKMKKDALNTPTP
jgi:hypothetical protein